MIKRVILLLFISVNMVNCQQLYDPGFDFALFDKTPVHRMSRAVESEDTAKISVLVKNDKLNVDYQEPKFGHSLLTLALQDNKPRSVAKLLQLGADPNIRSPKNNSTPFLSVCRYPYAIKNVTEMLSMLIKYGAAVNSLQVEVEDIEGHKSIIKNTALQYLCDAGTLDCVKILVNNGARLDTYPTNGTGSLIYQAVFNVKLDILRYLLIDKKVPIPDYCVIQHEGTERERKVTLRDLVNQRNRVMDAHQIAVQGEILAFLKDHGK